MDQAVLAPPPRVPRRSSPISADRGPAAEHVGSLYRDLGKFDSAEHHLRRALEIYRRYHGNEHTDVADSLNSLASCWSKR